MKIKFLYAQVIFLISILIFTTCDDLKEDFNIKSYKNPIKIAVVGDVTIGREFAENVFFAVKMAADEINSNGGLTINGVEREIELVFKNSGGTPEIGETVINELINENIDIIIGPTVSAVAVDMANLCIENNILMMTYSATVPELSYLNDRNLVWRTCPSDAFSGIVMADYAFDSLDINKGAILYREDKFGLAMKEIIAEEFILAGGEILATASYPTEEVELNLYDYSNQINHLLKFEPQIIFTIVFELEIGKITQDFWASPLYQDYVLKPKMFLTEGGFLQELIANGQPNVVETILGISSSITTSSNYITFKNNYFQKFDFEPVTYAEHAYDALYSIVYAMLKAQSVLPDDIKQSLRMVTGNTGSGSESVIINVNEYENAKVLLLSGVDINYEGASGAINFDENGDPESKFVIWGIRDGEYTEISYYEK